MSIFGKIFGSDSSTNPYKAASPYLNNIPGVLNNSYQPYVNLGQYGQQMQPELANDYRDLMDSPGAGLAPQLIEQYQQMAMNPNDYYAGLGSGFRQDPGYQWNLDQQLSAQDRAMAAGGMLGSPQHQKLSSQLASNLANQYYQNYLSNQLGIANSGLSGLEGQQRVGLNQSNLGLQGLNNIMTQDLNYGYNASNQLGQSMSDYWRNKAGLAAGRAQDSRNRIQGGLGAALGGFASGFKIPGGSL